MNKIEDMVAQTIGDPGSMAPPPADVAELSDWDPERCSCHLNPPCGYCAGEEGAYRS